MYEQNHFIEILSAMLHLKELQQSTTLLVVLQLRHIHPQHDKDAV